MIANCPKPMQKTSGFSIRIFVEAERQISAGFRAMAEGGFSAWGGLDDKNRTARWIECSNPSQVRTADDDRTIADCPWNGQDRLLSNECSDQEGIWMSEKPDRN